MAQTKTSDLLELAQTVAENISTISKGLLNFMQEHGAADTVELRNVLATLALQFRTGTLPDSHPHAAIQNRNVMHVFDQVLEMAKIGMFGEGFDIVPNLKQKRTRRSKADMQNAEGVDESEDSDEDDE